MEIFANDARFEVAIVSTYDYQIQQATNIPLSAVRKRERSAEQNSWHVGSTTFQKTTPFVRWPIIKPTFAVLARGAKLIDEILDAIQDYRTLKAAFRQFSPQVIFLQTLLYPSYLAYFLPRDAPVMITFWNGDLTWAAKWRGIEKLFKKWIVRHGIKIASAITVNSRTALDACLRLGAPAAKTNLIYYPGVDLERFTPGSKAEARKSLGLIASKVVLCPRGFGGYLNSDVIIEAAARVRRQYPDSIFLFLSDVGGKEQWVGHVRRARELGIEQALRWDGRVSWEKMPLYYHAADVMVSISSHDSLPNCMLEAMACGVPLVMGDIPQIREWVTDSINGYLAPPRDPEAVAEKITRIFEDGDQLVATFVKQCRERVIRDANSVRSAELVKTITYRLAITGRRGPLVQPDVACLGSRKK